jgi:hypothetical protein
VVALEATGPAPRHGDGPDAIDRTAGELASGREAIPLTSKSQLAAHPAADLFPQMAPGDYEALVADIKENGQLEPIIVHDGMILDGRHRYNACRKLGIAPKVEKWTGPGSPEAFAISMNLRRRHLDASQRAMVAAGFATLKRGGDQSAKLRNAPTAAALAQQFGVSARSIETARVVRTKGAPELVAAVQRGSMKVSRAADLVDLPKDRQRELAAAGKYEVEKAVKRVRRNDAIRREREALNRAADQRDNAPEQPADLISPPEAESLPLQTPQRRGSFVDDLDFQAEAEASARDMEIERDERIALAGAEGLAAENEKLTQQIAMQDKRIASLTEDLRAANRIVKMWKKRAMDAGWKERANA